MINEIVDIAKLVEEPKVEDLELPNKGIVRIRALTLGDIAEVHASAKDDVFKQTFAIVIRGVVEPKLDWETVKKLSPGVIKLISEKINEMSGFSANLVKEAKKELGPKGEK